LDLQPGWAEVHTDLAQGLLLHGEPMDGWKEEQWRWRLKDPGLRPGRFPQPLWDGGDLCAKTILLHAEQGFEDVNGPWKRSWLESPAKEHRCSSGISHVG
jgi:hypothetical protein